MVFGKTKEEAEEMVEMEEAKQRKNSTLDPALERALVAALKTIDMFKGTVEDVMSAASSSEMSESELKDYIARCKSHTLTVEKELKILRRRMQPK